MERFTVRNQIMAVNMAAAKAKMVSFNTKMGELVEEEESNQISEPINRKTINNRRWAVIGTNFLAS